MTILEKARTYCHNCDPLNAELIEYFNNADSNFTRECMPPSSVTTELLVSGMNLYEPSRVALNICEVDYDDSDGTVCENDRSKSFNLNYFPNRFSL